MFRREQMFDQMKFVEKFLQHYQSPEKIAFYVDESDVKRLNAACMCSNKLIDDIFTSQTSFRMQNSHYLYDIIEDTLQHIIPFGIPKHFSEYHKWFLYGRYDELIDSGPKVLTLEVLSFGFVLWLCACAISFVEFCFELVDIKMRRHFRTLIGFVLFFKLFYLRLNSCAYL